HPRRDRTMKKLLLMMGLLWGGGALGVWYWTDTHAQRVSYRTVPIKRGDLRSTINATGTIEPEEVVDVGAQVAGRIMEFGTDPQDSHKHIDYDAHVDEGTVLARIDDAVYKAQVDQAAAQLASAQAGEQRARADLLQMQAKLNQTERDWQRAQKL